MLPRLRRQLHRVGSWLKVGQRKRRVLIATIVALLAYPVLGTLALWSGFVEWIAKSEDMRLEISKPAFTLLPGRVHMKKVRLFVNGDTQFILEGDDLFFSINVLELVRRRIHVTRLAAHHVRYQMRVQVDDTQGIERRLAAYPKLEGLPGHNVVHEKAAERTEEREGSWTVEVDGIDISVSELWFFEYRYLGDGRLRGGFTVGPQIMEVRTAVQDLGPGRLFFGEKQPIASRLRGQVTCEIPEINPSEHADASFMELVNARVNLKADVLSLAHVAAYMRPDMRVTKGAGPLALDLYLEKGILGGKSRLDFSTDAVALYGQGFGVSTDWKLAFDATGEKGFPLGRSDFKSTYVSLARVDREFTIQTHGHHVEAALDTIRLSKATDLKRAAVRMPNIVSTDLDDFDVVLPESSPLSVKGGEAQASLDLAMDKDYWVTGPLKARLIRAKASVAGVELGANTWLDAQVKVNPKQKTGSLEKVLLRVRAGSMQVEDEAVDGWWMNLAAPRLSYWSSDPPRSEGYVSVRTKNLAPALEALAQKDLLSDIVPVLTRLDNFRAKTTFRTLGDVSDLTIESESDVWDVSGRVYSNPKQTLMALVIGGQAVSVGIADLGSGLQIRPFAKTDWLNERLAQFPKPLVQMRPDKP